MAQWEEQIITKSDVGTLDASFLVPKTKDEQDKIVRSIDRRCRGPLVGDPKMVHERALAQAAKGLPIDPSFRKGCGADYNDSIVANPYDGKDHSVTCPKCGTVSTYKAPLFI